ncbi:MAG: DNA-3-methyladenine glycosylase [Ardenticatenaceae bacterium]
MRLGRDFYERPAPVVARALLGMWLVRRLPSGEVLHARVVETEAYHGYEDSASHARAGPNGRAAIMFGEAGHAYVYLIYGMYDMLNVSTDGVDFPAAVLIRGVEPAEGVETMRALRGTTLKNLTSGPGKLCRAMAIDRSLNGEDVVHSETLWFEYGEPIPDDEVARSPRIGVSYADPEYRKKPWRFFQKGNKWVSI